MSLPSVRSIPMIRQAAVSPEAYHRFVEIRAYVIWHAKEGSRRIRNWSLANDRLGLRFEFISFSDPRWQTVRNTAWEVHEERKTGDALEDWFEAERDVAYYYTCKAHN